MPLLDESPKRSNYGPRCCLQTMASKWPFGKKNAPAEPKPDAKKAEVVEYERKSEDKQKELIEDKSHLKDKSFLDAMALLDDD